MKEGAGKKLERLCDEKANTVRSCLPDSWVYRKEEEEEKKKLHKYLNERPPGIPEG